MNPRRKKLAGSLGLLIGVFVYIIAVLQIAALLPHHTLVELPFYAFVGIVWIFPARSIIAWMHR